MLRAIKMPISLRITAKFARSAAIGCIALLLARAQILPGSPLCAALLAAAIAIGENAAAPVIGILLGSIRFPLGSTDIQTAACAAAVLAAELILSFIPALRGMAKAKRACITASFGTLIPMAIWANADLLNTARAVAAALLAGASAPFLLDALRIRLSRTRLSMRERTGAALIIGGCIAGMWGIYSHAAMFCAIFCALLLPATGGIGACALAICGAGASPAVAASLCGMTAGLPVYRNRRLRAPAVLGGCIALYYLVGQPHPIPALAACCAYVLVGEGLHRKIAHFAARSDPTDADALAQEVTRRARDRLRALGDAFGALAEEGCADTELPDEQQLIYEMRARLCDGCGGYAQCWMGEENRGARFLCRLIAEAAEKGDAPAGERVLYSDDVPPDVLRRCRRGRTIPERLGLMLADFARRRQLEILRGMGGDMMQRQFLQARDVLYALADRQAAPLRVLRGAADDLAAALDSAGLRKIQISAFDADTTHILLRRAQGWTESTVAQARRAAAQALGGDYAVHVRGEALRLTPRARLSCDTGAACQSGDAQTASGDSHMIRRIDDDRIIAMLSDGMGSGDAAAAESARALRLMWHFLRADIPVENAADCANRRMLMCDGDEIFATLDLCALDLRTGHAEFTKLAASRTLILRGDRIIPIDGAHLPLGIIEGVRGEARTVRVQDGDVIIMGSDGLMESVTIDQITDIARDKSASAQLIAERLTHAAATTRTRIDDITCLVLLLRAVPAASNCRAKRCAFDPSNCRVHKNESMSP